MTSAYPRTATTPFPGLLDFDVHRFSRSVVSSHLGMGSTVIIALLEKPTFATSVSSVQSFANFVNRTSTPKRDPVEISRHWRHLAFLREASTGEDAAITPHIARQATIAWSDIRRATGNRMPVPAAMSGPDGQMFYSWDLDNHHMELEIIPGEPAFFFYRDRHTGETWSEDYDVGEELSADVMSRLELFFQD